MNKILKKTLQLLTGADEIKMPAKPAFMRANRRQLIQRESELGGVLFGVIPAGRHRQFFNLDKTTWVWYEDWTDEAGKMHSLTTRYEVHANGVLKVQDKTPYYYIEGEELNNFVLAVHKYYEAVAKRVYHRDPATGARITV